MKKVFYTSLILSIGFLASCANAPQQTAQPAVNANTGAVVTKANNDSPLVASSHGAPKSSTANPHSGGDAKSAEAPMMTGNATPIDTTEYDAEIAKTEKAYKTNAGDAAAKQALADAYAKRAFALTEAAQYRAALGDFRKSLKLDPANTEAKSMHDQIVSIFQSMGREVPAEGTEPPPLPFKKGA